MVEQAVRSGLTQPSAQYLIIAFVQLLFTRDLPNRSETFLVDYFFLSIVFHKVSHLPPSICR